MMTRLSGVLLVAAVLLGGLAGYVAWRPTEPRSEPFATVDRPNRNLGEVAIGSHIVTFRISNPADVPRMIIGMAEG